MVDTVIIPYRGGKFKGWEEFSFIWEIFSNASFVGMGLILFYCWTIILFSNASIVGMGLFISV